MHAHPSGVKTAEPAKSAFLGQRTSDGLTILIVEDHDDTREMLRTLFNIWGCRVVEACNGLEAVETASREQPSLILMDGSLPFLDGLAATRRIRENVLLREVKIVALNGWGSATYDVAALAAGCDDSIVKPIDFERLRNLLNDLPRTPGAYQHSESSLM